MVLHNDNGASGEGPFLECPSARGPNGLAGWVFMGLMGRRKGRDEGHSGFAI